MLETIVYKQRQADKAEEAARAARRQRQTNVVASTAAVATVGNGLCSVGRGRAARNAPLEREGAAPAMEQRKATLLAKAECRRSADVVPLAPAGAGKLDDMPERDSFGAGSDGGV